MHFGSYFYCCCHCMSPAGVVMQCPLEKLIVLPRYRNYDESDILQACVSVSRLPRTLTAIVRLTCHMPVQIMTLPPLNQSCIKYQVINCRLLYFSGCFEVNMLSLLSSFTIPKMATILTRHVHVRSYVFWRVREGKSFVTLFRFILS